MKLKSLLGMAFAFMVVSSAASATEQDDFTVEPMCKVRVCNKLERFSLDPFSHLKDAMGETCVDTIIPKSQAHVGQVLSQESRWWQGSSINPTKKSVTRVNQVYVCQKGGAND